MGIALLIGIIGAFWTASLASRKNLNVLGYAILGFLLPLIGVLVVLSAEDRNPKEAP